MWRNSIIMVLAQAVVVIISYVFNWLLTHYLSQEDYGLFRYVLSISSLLMIISIPGCTPAIFKSIIDQVDRFVRNLYRMTIKYSLLGSVVLLFIAVFYILVRNEPLTGLLLFVAAIAFPGLVLDRWTMVYQAKGLFFHSRLWETCGKVLQLLIVGAAVWLSGNVVVVMICFALVYLAFNSAMVRRSSGIQVKGSGRVRRAKLYYLRERTGKAARLKRRFTGRTGAGSGPAQAEPPARDAAEGDR